MTNPRRTYSAVIPSSSRLLDDSMRSILSSLNFEEFSSNKKMKRSMEICGRLSGRDKCGGSHILWNNYAGWNRQGSSDEKHSRRKGKGKLFLVLWLRCTICAIMRWNLFCADFWRLCTIRSYFFLSIAACNIVVCVVPVVMVHDPGNLRNAACDCGSSYVQWATVKGAHCTSVFVITKYRFSYTTLSSSSLLFSRLYSSYDG